jgi:hypothetical protein
MSWGKVVLKVFDFDSMQSNDCIGQITLSPLREKAVSTEILERTTSAKIHGLCGCTKKPTLTYKIEHRTFPAGSRLRNSWRITIVEASSLPHVDKNHLKGQCDPFVEVVALSKDGQFCFKQQVSVKALTLEPEWNETIYIPEVADSNMLMAGLQEVIGDDSDERLESLMPPEVGPNAASSDGVIKDWTRCIDRWAQRRTSSKLSDNLSAPSQSDSLHPNRGSINQAQAPATDPNEMDDWDDY